MGRKSNAAPEHYVNNKEFSAELVKYIDEINYAKENDLEKPQIPNYLGECFLKICQRIASRPNFSNYSYKDDMISDALENCIKVLHNYDIKKSSERSKSGNINAFGYFSKIIWFAFLRRIEKEKKQQKIKEKYFINSVANNFIEEDLHGNMADTTNIIEKARNFHDSLQNHDEENTENID